MNAVSAEKFDWKKVLQTPVSQLMRGQVTGPQEPLELVDTSAFSDRLVESLWAVTDPLPGRLRVKSVRRLVQSCSSLLREGCAEAQLIEQLSEPASIATLIRATRSTDWIFNAPLPARLWPVVERIVVNPRVKWWSARRMLRRVCQNLRWQLDAGHAPDEIILQCGEAVALSGLAYETNTVGELLDYPLPENLMSVVLDVVQRSRLWPGEKRDVALELCAHFADGLEKGESEAALLESFGSPQTAAKLIRRARLRNRPLAWRARRRTWQGLLVMLLLLLIPWAVVTVRLMVAQPTIKSDPIENLDKQSRAIPRDERAWPLYLQGLADFSKRGADEFDKLRKANAFEGPASESWPEAKAFLNKHVGVVEHFLQAASLPELGFINRPRADDYDGFDEFWKLNRPYELNPPGANRFQIMLPQSQELGYKIMPVLTGAVYLAAEEGEAERCLELLLARINAADHYRQTGPWVICQNSANDLAGRAAELAKQIVERYPNLFNERQLKILQEQLSKMPIPALNLEPSEEYLKHILQYMYTDDGNGNGRFTVAGFHVLKRLVESSMKNREILLSTIPSLVWQDSREPDRSEWIPFQIKSGILALQIADRKEMRRELLYLNHLFWEAITKGTPETEAAYQEEYQRLMDSPALRIKYLPALMVMSPFQTSSYWTSNRKPLAQKMVALTLIAAELYRRKEGQLPETLEDLVPGYFAEVPVDPGTGMPLRYQIRDGQPVVEAESLSAKETK
ncbi:hypothetical protein Enr10x_00350 [Gimesia panareensis]|uniref:Uncharacterized protein n=1 Tax=Gimesia panareensis TaxID=2527978 RepID=A0A517PZD4_9PLAN|nr:hypothetical protein [Gimesia panareensis]QDT24745.1 hypothetical protein Enr10x_00350 [Gimesia panareensis]